MTWGAGVDIWSRGIHPSARGLSLRGKTALDALYHGDMDTAPRKKTGLASVVSTEEPHDVHQL
jgi:hypothetical protein